MILMVVVMLCVAATVMILRGIYYSTTAELNIPVVLAGAALGLMSQLGNALTSSYRPCADILSTPILVPKDIRWYLSPWLSCVL